MTPAPDPAIAEALGPLRLADTARALDMLQPGLDSGIVEAIHRGARATRTS